MHLSAEAVGKAALDIIDRDGVAALTMRGIAAELGVGPMSLYRHVGGRDDVTGRVVELLLDEVVVPDEPDSQWQDTTRRIATSVREMALRHPAAFELVADAPLFEPPVLLHVERIRRVHARQGIDEKEFVQMWTVIDSFVTGFLLMETQLLTRRPSPAVEQLIEVVPSLQERMRTIFSATSFDDALKAVIAGLERTMSLPDTSSLDLIAEEG